MTDNDNLNSLERNELGRAWARMISCIVHDLLTPLLTLEMAGSNLSDSMPNLIKNYGKAIEPNSQPLSENDLFLLENQDLLVVKKNPAELLDFLRQLSHFREQLLSNPHTAQPCTINRYIEKMVKDPLINEETRQLLTTNVRCDFNAPCAPIFIENLLANLLDNALYYIKKSGKGKIDVWTEEQENYYVLHFKDTAEGIDQDMLPRVFHRFFSKRGETIVPGLGLCRLALLQIGGDILCDSQKNVYTHFIVQFPKSI